MAHAFDLVGDRWALLVIRELMHGPKRYTTSSTTCTASGPTSGRAAT